MKEATSQRTGQLSDHTASGMQRVRLPHTGPTALHCAECGTRDKALILFGGTQVTAGQTFALCAWCLSHGLSNYYFVLTILREERRNDQGLTQEERTHPTPTTES